jgi:hypothetical protein
MKERSNRLEMAWRSKKSLATWMIGFVGPNAPFVPVFVWREEILVVHPCCFRVYSIKWMKMVSEVIRPTCLIYRKYRSHAADSQTTSYSAERTSNDFVSPSVKSPYAFRNHLIG